MIPRLLVLTASVSLFWAFGQARRKPEPPRFEVVEFKAQRNEDRIWIDGRVRNKGEMAVRFPVLVFQFLSSDNRVVSTRRTDLEPEELNPGDEAAFMLQSLPPARAVSIRLEMYDRTQRWYPLDRSGPYPIE
ncbi:MAG: DUF3426 domain-containing protein [Bryobacteraceae bacterium]|nr:DUF3426 domain-containing protein [Bryobacteraceae bacterium]